MGSAVEVPMEWTGQGAYRPYRKYRKCGMAGGDVPRGPPRAKIKKNGKSPREPKAREGLWTEVRECGGGG